MKKIFYLIIVSLFLLIACEDVLEEKPKSIVSENFYQTAGDFESAVNAILSPLRGYNCMGFLYTMQIECYSDFTHGRGSYDHPSYFEGLDNTNFNRTATMWEQFYQAIRNANLVISEASEATEMNESTLSRYVAEAKFLRAFTYFHMIRNWGKVVLRTEANIMEAEVPLSNADAVYALIIEDLKYAEQNLPDDPSVAGRPTKWSAKAVLADVYFNRDNYIDAESKATEIINSNKFSMVEVKKPDDFQNLYGPDLVSTSEEIFYIKYNRESGWSLVNFMHHPSGPYYNNSGLFALYLDTIYHTQWGKWDDADLRKQLFYPWDIGIGPHTMLATKFIDTERIGAGGNDFPVYRYAETLLLYAEANSRNNNGPTADAMEKLNMVHRRGYGKDYLQPSEIDYRLEDYSDLQSFLDLVLLERGYETYLEGGKRWLDLKRLGREKTRKVIKEGTGRDIVDKHFLWPIPENEIALNEAVGPEDQNPGY